MKRALINSPLGLLAVNQRHWSESRLFTTAVLLLMLLVSGAVWWQHIQSSARLRVESTSQIQLRATQVTSAAAAAVSILFRSVDVAALAFAKQYDGSQGLDENARQAVERLPPGTVLQVAIIDSQGYLAYSNLGQAKKVSLGDREHFKVHLTSGKDALFISKPLFGRVSKQWTIQFSRPIIRGGSFLGVVVLSVSPEYVQSELSKIALNQGDFITVARRSGEFLARNQDMDATLGKSVEPDLPYLAVDTTVTGDFVSASSTDEVGRINHWQLLSNYPVVVVLGLNSKTAFQSVERAIAEDAMSTVAALVLLWAAGLGMAMLVRRIHAQSRGRVAMETLAMVDPLTGLKSRHALMVHLKQAILQAAESKRRVGILYIDLDGFKPVNDQYGHAAGDEVLKAVAGRIGACVRSNDVVARIGGDEFAVVLSPLVDDASLQSLKLRISQSMAAAISVSGASGVSVHVGASIGLASYPEHGLDADALLNFADHEMYDVKKEHHDQVQQLKHSTP